MKTRARVLLGGGLAVGLVAAGLLLPGNRGKSFPAPAPAPADSGPVFGDFVGAETCADCHASQFAQWRQSTHGRAGGPPSPGRVIAPFTGSTMGFSDAEVTPAITPQGTYVFRVHQEGGGRDSRVIQVDAVVGGGFMVGGGTQAFFSRFPDGTLRFLPFDYSYAERRWFCQLRSGRGWIPVSREISLDDCDAWPPRRVLGRGADGVSERFQSCQQCHGSQIELSFDTTAKRYETRFTTLAINCESCHGPGRRHAELMRSGTAPSRGDIGMTSLATLTKDASITVCFQCHAVKTSLAPGYLPGKRLEDHYALKLPLLLDSIYFADGRTRVFAYQESHLASDCYLNGSMTCVDCHDPHTQEYRDVNGAPLPGRFDDGQCLGCHPSKAEPIERHTRHPESSPGSRCVSCHMPYLQQPNVGKRVRYARSDHAIPIPRPRYDALLGIQNACVQCHRDQTPETLEARVAAWWGTVKPHPQAIAAAMSARQTSDAVASARTLLAVDQDRHPWAEFVGLADVFQRLVQPDMMGLERATVERIERRARSPDLDNRALALAALHLARGDDPSVKRFLAGQLRSLGPHDRAVRARWAWILRVRGDQYLGKQDYAGARLAYQRVLEVLPNDVDGLRGLGTVYTRQRDFPLAVRQFERVLERYPRDGQALVGIGFARLQAEDFQGAITAFRRAIEANPWDPAGHANLGLAQLRAGTLSAAIESFLRAIRLEPGLAASHFALAEAYGRQGRLEEAALALERGLRIEPGNAAARRMLQALRARP